MLERYDETLMLRQSFVTVALAAAVLLVGGCSRPSGDTDLVGKWVSQMFMGSETMSEGPDGFTLTFEPDGSFTGTQTVRTMMILDAEMTGTYKRTGNRVVLSGSNKMSSDDGYRKETNTVPFEMALKIEKDRLVVETHPDVPTNFTFAFRREGAPLLTAPQEPEPEPSTDEAKAVVAKVKAAYAAMKTYADEGTFESGGRGFRAKRAEFRTRFSADGRFLFRVDIPNRGAADETSVVWADAEKSWLYMGDVGGHEERPIGNGLGILTVTVDSAATFVASLLKLRDVGDPAEIDRLESLRLLDDETVKGVECFVLEGNEGDLGTLKVWVDKKSYLVRRLAGSFIEYTADFSPRPDATISASEFKFTPPD